MLPADSIDELNPRYYGWKVVGAILLAEFFAIGSTSYAFGLFVIPVSAEFDLTRAQANSGMICLVLGMGLSSPLLGSLLDRFDPRYVFTGGALVLGGGLVALGLSTHCGMMALILFTLVGPGAGAIGPMAGSTVVSRWFCSNRGRALGIASLGASLGGVLLVPVLAFNQGWAGWRGALIIQGLLVSMLVVLVALIVVRRPPRKHPLAMPVQTDEGAGHGAPPVRVALRELLGNRSFIGIGLSVALVFSISQAILISLVPHVQRLGVSPSRAALLIAVLAISSMLGKLMFGVLADRFKKRRVLTIIIVFVIFQLLVLLAEPSFHLLLVALAVTGLATGGELPVRAALIGDYFDTRSYGWIIGVMNLVNMSFNLVLIACVGAMFDSAGHYQYAFLSLLALAFISLSFSFMITAPRAT
jgi:MFS family permease